jgi:hypothetical protein
VSARLTAQDLGVLVLDNDDMAAGLAANTQDFLSDLLIRDRIAGLTAVADELHP